MPSKKWCVNLLAVLLGGLLAAGCSNSASRQARRNILDEIQTAQRLYNQALSLMAGTAYKVRGEYGPVGRELDKKLQPEEIEPAASQPANPKALQVLAEAEKGLDKALSDNGAADPADKARAQEMLGRISVLKGQYYDAEGYFLGDRTSELLSRVNEIIAARQSQQRLRAYLAESASANDNQVTDQQAAAKADEARLLKDIQDVGAGIAAAEADDRDLAEQNKKLVAEARNLRIDSRNASGAESIRLFDQAEERQRRVNKNSLAILKSEDKITDLQARLRLLKSSVEEAQGRLKAAGDFLKDRAALRDRDRQEAQKLEQSLAQARNEVGRLLQAAGAHCELLKTAEDNAVKAFQLAGNRFQRASREQGQQGEVDLMVQQAGAMMAEGHVYVRSLALQSRIDRVLKTVSQWTASAGASQPAETQPAGVESLRTVVVAGEKIKQEAQGKFKQASELYERALVQARRDAALAANRWIYEEGAKSATAALQRLEGGAPPQVEQPADAATPPKTS